jgi:hypothetical protein
VDGGARRIVRGIDAMNWMSAPCACHVLDFRSLRKQLNKKTFFSTSNSLRLRRTRTWVGMLRRTTCPRVRRARVVNVRLTRIDDIFSWQHAYCCAMLRAPAP